MGQIELFYVHTEDNIADILTKNLAIVKFSKFKDLLGIEFYENQLFQKLTPNAINTHDPGTLLDLAAKSLV